MRVIHLSAALFAVFAAVGSTVFAGTFTGVVVDIAGQRVTVAGADEEETFTIVRSDALGEGDRIALEFVPAGDALVATRVEVLSPGGGR
ncbi:MAG: hypothetical protein ACREQY_11400 [Candidatus Binatia bacterium]